MANRTRLETLFEGDDAPAVHYKPRSLPSRPTNTKQFPSLANHYHTVHGLHNYSITTILEDSLPASAKYLDLPQQQLQQYHARGTTTSPTTPCETTTPQQQKFSLAHFWNRHLFTAPTPPQQHPAPASPSSSPPTPEPNRPTSATPGVTQNNNNNNNTNSNASPKSSHSSHSRHPQRSASSSSSLSYTLSPSSSSPSSSSSSTSTSTSSESRSSSSTSVSDSGPTISGSTLSASPTTTSTSLSHLVLGTISKRSSRGLTLPFTSSTNNKSPSLASAPVPLTTTTTHTNGSPITASSSSGAKVPLARSQSHSAVMVKRTSPSLVASSVWQQQQHQQGVHGGRRGRDDQEEEEEEEDQQDREEAFEQGQQQKQQQQQHHQKQQQHDPDVRQPTYLSIKKRVASGQAQLDHYRSMIQQLDAQSGVFVSQQQELRERRDHVARAVESLENVLHRPWQTTTTSTSCTVTTTTSTKNHASRPTSVLVDSSEQAKQALAAKLGRRRSLPNNANHAGEGGGGGGGGGRTGKEEGGGERGGRGLFVFTQPSLWSTANTPSVKAVVLHSHDVSDAEKDDTDDMFVHPSDNNKRSTIAPGSVPLATLSPSSESSPNSNSHRSRDDPLFKADCERCILKEELLQKRCALQQLQCEIERVQQRLNSCASQVRMIQRTFVGPIEQHLAMDQSELGRLERAIKS